MQYILTKGDNNQVDDRGLYNPGQLWIHRKDVVGKVRGYVLLKSLASDWKVLITSYWFICFHYPDSCHTLEWLQS